jgi:DNA polymerase III alpha subunit (gram-positive type)
MKKKKEKINFRDRKLLFVDLETTGLDVDVHEIVEVGCLVVNGRTLKVEKEYHAKVKPQHIETADKEALEINQYSEKAWKDAKPLKEVLREVIELAPKGMIAGWKVDFDWQFLEKGFKKYGMKHNFDYHLLDVVPIAYRYFLSKKKPMKLGLRDISRSLGIEIPDKHDAMTDIKATYKVFRKLV